MLHSPIESTPSVSNSHLLLAYVADLELEVDRLRKQGQFVQHEVRESLTRIQRLCTEAMQARNRRPPVAEIDQVGAPIAFTTAHIHSIPKAHPTQEP